MSDDGTSARKIDRGPGGDCPVGPGSGGIWTVRGHAAARSVLRSKNTVQAGFGLEMINRLPANIRRPVLHRDGPEHREDRRRTARYFTPRRVDQRYRPVMRQVVDRQITTLRREGAADLAELSFPLAIEVAAEVIGLTESRPGIRRRLERFFPDGEFGRPGFTSLSGLRQAWRQAAGWFGMYFGDVRPALRARRAQRRDDVVSHLLDQGCSPTEILGECITYAAAGMVTTREFVIAAAWHLFTDAALLQRYRDADEPRRHAILHEILRLEPVIPKLRRRTTDPVEVPDADGTVTVPSGAVVDVDVAAANTDPRAVGGEPLALCPGRSGAEAAGPGLSFGDGPHRCPGSSIAILETDVFLSELFALPGLRMQSPPRVTFSEATGSYELRGLVVRVPRGE